MEDGYHDQQAESLISMNRLRKKLVAVSEERSGLEGRFAELADGEERIRRLEELPALVEEYLRDLPYLVGRRPIVREYETVGAERAEANPLGLYALSPDSIRYLTEEDLEEKQLVEEERAERLRQVYAMLDLHMVCHKDRSLE